MIVTVTLNPCIDKTISVDRFKYGGTNSVDGERNDISGKGINVSIALNHLGVDTICTGLNYTDDKELVEKALNEEGIPFDFIDAEGSLRTNTKIFDESNRTMTECNAKGTEVSKEVVGAFLDRINKLLAGMQSDDLLVVDGSVPKGFPADIYKTLTEIAKQYQIRAVMDASGIILEEGIKAQPYAVKPNKDEFEMLFSRKMNTTDDVILAADELVKKGIQYVCVSMGSEGALLVTKDCVLKAEGMKLDVKGVQGAGDSLVAGMCAAFYENRTDEEILRSAVATASGSLLHDGTQLCTKEDFDRLYDEVTITRLR